MRTSRRVFFAGGLASLYATFKCVRPGRGATRKKGTAASGHGIVCLDYSRSFICNTASFNAVRFWIESRTVLIDPQRNSQTEFYQCGSCKSENTFAEKNLFHKGNYDFLPIYGGGDLLIFRRPAGLSNTYRQISKAEDVWGEPRFKLRPCRHIELLTRWEQIRDRTAAGVPLVSQTEIHHPDTGLRAVIECPIKTMNISLDQRKYQVDTGPVALPDLSRRHEPAIASLRLAFVAFNTQNFADFVVEQPTSVIQDGTAVCEIYHYSKPFSMAARNRLFAVDPG